MEKKIVKKVILCNNEIFGCHEEDESEVGWIKLCSSEQFRSSHWWGKMDVSKSTIKTFPSSEINTFLGSRSL
jgi:hypothetical protein